ncbi:MAG: hypothetical protein ACLQIJ_06505 [Polyangia bacterium]
MRCILSLIAHAIIVMRNWSVAGSIDGHAARSDTQIQAAHLRDFVQEFQRSVSGHQGRTPRWKDSLIGSKIALGSKSRTSTSEADLVPEEAALSKPTPPTTAVRRFKPDDALLTFLASL